MSKKWDKKADPWLVERMVVLATFYEMLQAATGDGSKKRKKGLKPPWWRDPSHEAAIFSHLNKWKHGEIVDPDSGAHPLVHAAWRCLAIAYQETHGQVDPGGHEPTREELEDLFRDDDEMWTEMEANANG